MLSVVRTRKPCLIPHEIRILSYFLYENREVIPLAHAGESGLLTETQENLRKFLDDVRSKWKVRFINGPNFTPFCCTNSHFRATGNFETSVLE